MIQGLAGKRVLITGASGGIGKALVEAFGKGEARIAISGTSQQKLEGLKDHYPFDMEVLPCDLSNREQTNKLIDQAIEKLGGLDIVICNAGITKDNIFLRMSEDDFIDVLNVNLTSSFILNKAALRVMIKQKWGRVINISSIIGFIGNFGQANYAASKAGLIGMTKSLAREVASRGITVNAIAPGFIETPMTEALTQEQRDKIIPSIPSGVLGRPEDIAGAAIFLASDLANYITGQTLHVNGGLYMA